MKWDHSRVREWIHYGITSNQGPGPTTLPNAARPCHKFHEIAEPLISVKQLVQNGCTVHFISNEVVIKDGKTGEPLLRGQYSPTRNLYTVPLHTNSIPPTAANQPPPLRDLLSTLHNAYGAMTYEQNVIPKLIKWYHTTAGFPATSTWLRAINNGFYSSWPGLTTR